MTGDALDQLHSELLAERYAPHPEYRPTAGQRVAEAAMRDLTDRCERDRLTIAKEAD